MCEAKSKQRESVPAVLVRKELRPRRSRWTLCASVFASLAVLFFASPASAQLYDALDAYPPRWFLDRSDCDARVVSQNHLADGGLDGRGCETITVVASHGTEAILVYPIEPVRPIDDLTANVNVMSARDGYRIGFRVRFPYLRNETDRRAAAAYVFGTAYDRPGQFALIGVGMIERELRLKTIALRRQHGSDADLRDPYIDAVVINAYGGPGTTSLRIDELHVDGLVPIGDRTPSESKSMRLADEAESRRLSMERPVGPATGFAPRAFPAGQVTRILQHNGEPLGWVRSLGFDAVLLARPPDAEILREAIQSQMTLYAPPPSAPDPALQTLLEPVAGWYIGSGETLDSNRVAVTRDKSETLRKWPSVWQRPLIATPLESRRQYEPLLDAVIHDLPHPVRGLTGEEEVGSFAAHRNSLGDRVEWAVGVSSMPPESLLIQTDAIADRVGAPRTDSYAWHAMWLQSFRALENVPAAILFRSTRSLASGDPIDSQRSMALSYVNRMIAMISPWIANASVAPPVAVTGAVYRSGRLSVNGTDLYLLSTASVRGPHVLAGDGATLEISLPPSDANKTVWRMTHFSAERLPLETTSQGTRVEIVSPDAVEILVASSDPSEGGRLSQSASRFARQAGLDRWQLTDHAVRRSLNDWNLALAARVLDARGNRSSGANLANVAAQTLADAEPLYRAGDVDASLRMARRADAWALRSDWQLLEALMPDWPNPTSCPPVLAGNLPVQVAWLPLMNETGWGKNRLPSSPTLPTAISQGGTSWDFGRRMQERAASDVLLVRRGALSTQAFQAKVTPKTDEQLPGGYEGTVIQMASPAVRVGDGTAIRIDAMIRTIGFGGPHQGVLVYDSIGGQELGVLVRGQTAWTPVRLYRQAVGETDVRVMLELIGAGEAIVDNVQLRVWEPAAHSPPPTRPIGENSLPY